MEYNKATNTTVCNAGNRLLKGALDLSKPEINKTGKLIPITRAILNSTSEEEVDANAENDVRHKKLKNACTVTIRKR